MEVKGKIVKIENTKTVGNDFKVREFVIETDDQYPQFLPMQMVKDNVTYLDKFKAGDEVTCHINLNGRKYAKKDGSGDGYFLSITTWRIENAGATADAPPSIGEKDESLPF